jgi:peptidoglycan/xylan/chitin deacetylase (PgdA/CDA1 family)
MSLLEFVEATREESVPDRAVVVTFDDGYANNYTKAMPLLESLEIPATVFVTTCNIDSLRRFWWDELERVLLRQMQVPGHLRLRVQAQEYQWPTTTSEQRESVYKVVHRLMRPLSVSARSMVLSEMANWSGLDQVKESECSKYRSLRTDELVLLAQSDCIEIGGHTVTHPHLTFLSTDEQYAEIAGGRRKLEAILNCPVLTFSYPYSNYTDETVEIVKAVGFQAAVDGHHVSGKDLFRLRRYAVYDWEIECFKQRLEGFFHGSD